MFFYVRTDKLINKADRDGIARTFTAQTKDLMLTPGQLPDGDIVLFTSLESAKSVAKNAVNGSKSKAVAVYELKLNIDYSEVEENVDTFTVTRDQVASVPAVHTSHFGSAFVDNAPILLAKPTATLASHVVDRETRRRAASPRPGDLNEAKLAAGAVNRAAAETSTTATTSTTRLNQPIVIDNDDDIQVDYGDENDHDLKSATSSSDEEIKVQSSGLPAQSETEAKQRADQEAGRMAAAKIREAAAAAALQEQQERDAQTQRQQAAEAARLQLEQQAKAQAEAYRLQVEQQERAAEAARVARQQRYEAVVNFVPNQVERFVRQPLVNVYDFIKNRLSELNQGIVASFGNIMLNAQILWDKGGLPLKVAVASGLIGVTGLGALGASTFGLTTLGTAGSSLLLGTVAVGLTRAAMNVASALNAPAPAAGQNPPAAQPVAANEPWIDFGKPGAAIHYLYEGITNRLPAMPTLPSFRSAAPQPQPQPQPDPQQPQLPSAGVKPK